MMGTPPGARHSRIRTLTALVLLILLGLCLAHDSDDPGLNLCGSALLAAVAFLASVVLLSAGRSVFTRPLVYYFTPGDCPTLPPRV